MVERLVHRVTAMTKVFILPLLLFLHMDCTLRLIRFKVFETINPLDKREDSLGGGSAHHPLGKLRHWKTWAEVRVVTGI